VKVQRQTATNQMSLEKVKDMRLVSYELESQMRDFWANQMTMTIAELLHFGARRRVMESEWQEILRLNASSVPCHEDYLRFIVEVSSDFHRAVLIKNRIDYLKEDRVRKLDSAFLSFLQIFPQYLTRNIMNHRGVIFDYSPNAEGTMNDSTDAATFESFSADGGRFSVEEQAAKRILKYGHLSVILSQFLSTMRARSYSPFLFYLIFALVDAAVANSVLFGVLIRYFDRGREMLMRVLSAATLYATSGLSALMEFARITGRIGEPVYQNESAATHSGSWRARISGKSAGTTCRSSLRYSRSSSSVRRS
jgi:hypothetical protein